MGDKYRVLVGINYPPDDKRAEVGDVVEDLPDFAVKKLLAANVVEKFVEPEIPDAPVAVPAAPENTPAELADGLKAVQDAGAKGADGIDVLKTAAAPEEPAQEAKAPEAQPDTAEPAAEPAAPAEAPAEPAPVETPAEGATK